MEEAIKKYAPGDLIEARIALQHYANVVDVYVPFQNVDQEGVEIALATYRSSIELLSEPYETVELSGGFSGNVYDVSGVVPEGPVLGVYSIRAVNVLTAGGRWVRSMGGELGDLAGMSFEIVDERAEDTRIQEFWFVDD